MITTDSKITARELTEHVRYKNLVDVFLVNGIKLKGRIEDCDDVALVFDSGQLVFFHAISTIQPSR